MKKILSLILGLNLLLGAVAWSPLAWAEEANATPGADAATMTQAVQQSSLLLQLKQKLAQIQYRYTLLQKNIEDAKVSIVEINAQVINLEMVIANLDKQIKDTGKQTLDVKSQKEQGKMDVAQLEEDIQILQLQFEDQKQIVGDLMTLLYVKRDVYYDEDGVNPVKVLASTHSVSETLQKITYLDLIESENQTQVDKMADLSTQLAEKWNELRIKKQELDALDLKLADETIRLQGERDAQEAVLEETKVEQAILEGMLGSADQRKDELLHEIKIYQENVKMMEEKLAGTSGLLSEDQRTLIEKIEQEMIANIDGSEAADFLQLDWPVAPGNGITAFFHDEGYQATFGVDHYAVDIRAKQGTAIFAPADGVVSEVIFDAESTRFAYIMVAHRMGTMTLYGHISEPTVSAGDYVTRGQILGFTGGMPGTPGSGGRTTGPHLHFEVWQDGVRVDPLKYLPLDEVAMENLPEEYLDQIQSALEDQIKQIQEAMGL